jgi:hypothetical protein
MEYSANYGDVKCLIETNVALKMAGGLLGAPLAADESKYEIFSCYNAGSVAVPASTSGNGVGGLLGQMSFLSLGSDPLTGITVRPAFVSCFNYGTVTYSSGSSLGAARSGGTASYNTVGNAVNISDIYYLDSSAAKRFYGSAGAESLTDIFVSQTATEFADGTVLAALLETSPGEWVQGTYYPELKAFSDMTPPRLADELAARAGAAAASVTFTSGEDGEYYCAIAPAGAAVPDIDTSGAGLPLTAGEPVTITLGEGDLGGSGAYVAYIAVKDALGNVSVYDIPIPAYTAPGGEDDGSGGCDAGLSGLALAVLALGLSALRAGQRVKER